MNITTIYKEMESNKNSNPSIYFNYLKEYVNSPSFDLSEVLLKNKKYPRALCSAVLSIKNPETFYTLLVSSELMPIFTFHMVLIKCSAELLNSKNSNEDLQNLLEIVISGVSKCAHQYHNPGTTLSFAFGFVLGTAIKRGVNVKEFFNKFDHKFIVSNKDLFHGFISGLNLESKSLASNQEYLVDLKERYENWEDESRRNSLNMFLIIPSEKINEVALNQENLSILEYFSGRSISYNTFLEQYKNKIQTLNLETNKKHEYYTDNIYKNDNSKSIITQQKEEIKTLNNQLALYQSIFKQIDKLLPNFHKTLESTTNNDTLLNKVKIIINEQQQKIIKLQSYYDEGQKDKTIIEKIKNSL